MTVVSHSQIMRQKSTRVLGSGPDLVMVALCGSMGGKKDQDEDAGTNGEQVQTT